MHALKLKTILNSIQTHEIFRHVDYMCESKTNPDIKLDTLLLHEEGAWVVTLLLYFLARIQCVRKII